MPILVVSPLSLEPRYIVHPGWIYPGDSIWSRLAKFAYWNCLKTDELAALFAIRTPQQRDLRKLPRGERYDRLCHHLRLKRNLLATAYPPKAGVKIANVVSASLRGCRHCFRLGYHHALYQLTWLSHCPIHHQPMRDGCPRCRCLIPYVFGSDTFRKPYRCPGCRRAFCPALFSSMHAPPPLDPQDIQTLKRWQRYLVHLITQTAERCKRASEERAHTIREEAVSFMLAWHKRFRNPPLWRTARKREIGSQPDHSSSAHDILALRDVSAVLYKAVRRKRHALLSKHAQKQVHRVLKAYKKPHIWIPASKCPPEVFTFIAWRMYWEFTRFPNALFKRSLRPFSVTFWLIQRPVEFGEGNRQTLFQVLYGVLDASYQSFTAMARWMAGQGGYLWDPLIMGPEEGRWLDSEPRVQQLAGRFIIREFAPIGRY